MAWLFIGFDGPKRCSYLARYISTIYGKNIVNFENNIVLRARKIDSCWKTECLGDQ